MYKGVVPFIALQLIGLMIVGFSPSLVNYLPNRVYLTSETAPPPRNPRLQACLEEYLFAVYDRDSGSIETSIAAARALPLGSLPDKYQESLEAGFKKAEATFGLVANVTAAQAAVTAFIPGYAPLHAQVRDIRVETVATDRKLERLAREKSDLARFGARNGDDATGEIREIEAEIADLNRRKDNLAAGTPPAWAPAHKQYLELAGAETKARRAYRRNVDEAYASESTGNGARRPSGSLLPPKETLLASPTSSGSSGGRSTRWSGRRARPSATRSCPPRCATWSWS